MLLDGQIGQLYELMQALQAKGEDLANEEMDEALNVTLDESGSGDKKS